MSRRREIFSIHGSSYLRERVVEYLHLLYLHLCAFTRVRGTAPFVALCEEGSIPE